MSLVSPESKPHSGQLKKKEDPGQVYVVNGQFLGQTNEQGHEDHR